MILTGKTTGVDLSTEALDALARVNCPHCRAGLALERNGATRELTHRAGVDTHRGGFKVTTMQITLCWSDGLRREFEDNG